MKDWNWKNILVSGFLVVILLVIPGVMVGVGYDIGSEGKKQDLPKIEITLNDITIEDLFENGKEIKNQNNTLKLVDDGAVQAFTDVEVKGRGNATWGQAKKPLQFKLAQKADLLGLGKRRKWIFLANAVDATNLRTDTAFYIEGMLGEKYVYRGKFVDVYVDGDYLGLYYLTRGIEIGKNAVDLKDPLGILAELDNVYCKLEAKCYTTGNGESFTVKDVVVEENAELAMRDFLSAFNKLEVAIKNNDYREIERLVDVESFARYYLISELTANTDAYFTSHYFYKDGSDDKIHAGPAWDFDISLNNGNNIAPNGKVVDWVQSLDYLEPEKQYWEWSRLFARLIVMPEFRQKVNEMFVRELSGRKDELIEHIEAQAELIRKSALKDGAKWSKENFDGEVARLVEWLSQRYDYFEEEFGQIAK